MKVYDFTVPQLAYYEEFCNFSPQESALFDLRKKGVPLEQCAESKYAQDLLDSMRNTALANGTAGYHPYKNTTMQRYVSKDFAESMQQAYRVMKVAVDNRKTYGEVIDVLKRQDFLKYAESLRNQAKHKGVSVKKYVDDLMEAAKKKRKS